MNTRRMTMGQALVEFLIRQRVRRDDVEHEFFAGVWGIFGHGNVAGLGQALHEKRHSVRYYLCRNEQAMVHAAAAFAKMNNRLRTFACTTSIGPGATNMITAAAGATINRLPVLLLPGDIFAARRPAPVLQQLESPASQDVSVNDCFKPISRYWDRINRPDQLGYALMDAMRVLTSPAETGAVTLALPQDVQAEAWDYPEALFEPRVWIVARSRADAGLLAQAAALIRGAKAPVIVAGGGAIYSEATESLRAFAEATGIAVGETQAGKGALRFDHPQSLGAVGVTGTLPANVLSRDADVVIVVGSRLSDFTTASKTAFANANVRFININVAEFDAAKHAAIALTGDARVTLDELRERVSGYAVPVAYREQVSRLKAAWEAEVDRLFTASHGPLVSQAEVIGLVSEGAGPRDVVVNAAGSIPGDLHKLWRARDPKGYHMEYGYSCMGYEIAGGLGVKLAAPDREVYVFVGDGSYLMMAQEIVTAVSEGVKLTIVILDNRGFASIGGLSRSVGCAGFGTEYRYRNRETGQLDGDHLPVDLAANAASLGAAVISARTRAEIREALQTARASSRTTAIVVPVDRHQGVPGYESWWDVPVAEVSTVEDVGRAREVYVRQRARERQFL
jgi:3D-(3,5/4)-trihydroxycyclohexane-1,2-dione acylhydrolase (decyclizing)